MKVEEESVGGFSIRMFFLKDIVFGIARDIGPRILYVAGMKRPKFNLFGVLPEIGVQTPTGFWRIYGGHRLWSSPEAMPRSYSIDDRPVEIAASEGCVTIDGNPETENSIQKKITVRPSSENGVQVTHSIRNIGRWPIKVACWALSVMRQNGFAVMPLKPSKVDEHGLLPDRHVTLWPYTDPSDERLRFANGYIFVKQNPEAQKPLKIGAMANPSWIAYCVEGTAFVKGFSQEKVEYPDFGVNAEVYTNASMLELETVGPLKTLEPNECVDHTEIWKIFDVGDLVPEPTIIKAKLEVLLSE